MAKEIGKDVNAQEDAAKTKYTFRDIYDKVPHKTYSAHGDETYKQQTQQNFLFFYFFIFFITAKFEEYKQ